MNHTSPDLAQRIAGLPDHRREMLEAMLEQFQLSDEQRAERHEAPERRRPTPEDLESATVDTRLALYIVARMAIEGDLHFDVSGPLNSEKPQQLLYAVRSARDAIREIMPELDMTELHWLSEAGTVKQP